METESCRAMHLGLWLIEPQWAQARLAAIRAGLVPLAQVAEQNDRKPYRVEGDGIAIVPLNDMLMKGWSKFGGTSTLWARKTIRAARDDDKVKGILLAIDSPGGTVAGTQELANEVARANERKPVWAQVNDLAASAAYWTASQARKIYANETAEIGSIGTVAIVDDTSGEAQAKGVRVHVISTGEYKGAFVEGAPVTDEQLAYVRERVEDLNAFFLKAVKETRELDKAGLEAVSDGRVWIAKKAKALKLIDGIQSDETTLGMMSERYGRRSRTRAEAAGVRIKLAESS